MITPGFVEAGIYSKLKTTSGYSAPASFGVSKPETVSRAVLRAVERNIPEIIINPIPIRPLLLLSLFLPSAGEWVTDKLGANRFFHNVAQAQKNKGQTSYTPTIPARGDHPPARRGEGMPLP